MSLPSFKDFRVVWVEKTKASHGHGGPGWEFGTCLWSPTTDKLGKRIYRNMTSAEAGDLVLHFYEDALYGRELDHYFCGVSVVGSPAETRNQEPPNPGEWAGRGEYYRIALRDFTSLAEPIPLRKFADRYQLEIASALTSGVDQPFINYRQSIRLAQGKYLSRCGKELYELLSQTVEDVVAVNADPTPALSNGPRREDRLEFDYEEYVEGQRTKREAWFFARNPRLVQDAKDHYKCQCQACFFRYDTIYPNLGNGFIEVHHLNPLSERQKAEGDRRLTSLSQVAVLCANCHRMIHRLIRRLRRPVSIEEFRTHLVGGA